MGYYPSPSADEDAAEDRRQRAKDQARHLPDQLVSHGMADLYTQCIYFIDPATAFS
jgi:hypothetical protein